MTDDFHPFPLRPFISFGGVNTCVNVKFIRKQDIFEKEYCFSFLVK